MRDEPSANLVACLARLHLATAEQVQSVAPRVMRLGNDLPDFESVWVDALAQARILSPFQAAEINSGRGDALVHGSYVVLQPLPSPHYATCYAARHIDTARAVRIYVVRQLQKPAAIAARALHELIQQLQPLRSTAACVVEDAGMTGPQVWAVCPAVEGTTAADWMVENGRFPASVVLHIAQEMLARLVDLERQGVVHGDLGAAGLLVQPSGHVVLPMAGLRGIVRPSEGYSFADLQPEAYDYLAVERISAGNPPDIAGDVYACGCLWWHLLTGRPPFAGGNALAKLRAVHAAKVVDVRQLAPETPEVLARAIGACLAPKRENRPHSMAQLATLLGETTRQGYTALGRCLRPENLLGQGTWRLQTPSDRSSRRLPLVTTAAAVAILFAIGLWPVWRRIYSTRAVAVSVAQASPTLTDALSPTNVSPRLTAAQQAKPQGPTARSPVEDDSIETVAFANPIADLVLPTDQVVRLDTLDLQPGQRVRGGPGKRPLVSVPSRGLVVSCEDVTFEGIDFICQESPDGKPRLAMAMITIEAEGIAWRRCSFSNISEMSRTAIVWKGSAAPSNIGASELSFDDCVFHGVAAAVDCQRPGGLTVAMHNVLCVAAGPIMRLHRSPAGDESVTISLDHTTIRGDSAVLECRSSRLTSAHGQIAITATDSAFDAPDGGLLIFVGPQPPDSLLASVSWSGQGSLVTPQTPIVVWRSSANRQEIVAEEKLEIAGLVRSDVEFAGNAESLPGASRITRWQVPLRSADPPGADPNSLFLPKRKSRPN